MLRPALAGITVALSLVGTPADATVRIGPERIVVDAGAASAVVQRSPVRISFRDRRGVTVLGQVANRLPAPLVEPPTVDPEPNGVDLLPETTLYAPLTLHRRQERIEQFPGPGPFVADLLQAERSGMQYAARAVVGARTARGAGVRLALSTNDPTGRRLSCRCARWAAGRSACRRGRRRATG